MRDRTEVAELVAKLYDRLDKQFGGGNQVVDAVLLVEVENPDETVMLDDGTDEDREVPATIILLESTEDRVTVQVGLVTMALETMKFASDE